jgi:mannose-1-phosphate guanylyltransferase
MLHLVIMAGGSGTRFWPESRRARPKQFLALAGERTLLQQAADRCRPWIPIERMHVVTGAAYAAETRRQLPDLPPEHVLQEPCGRNTAPCIALAALHVSRLDPDATILVTPADHLIRPEGEFRATVEQAVALLDDHPRASVLMGIRPTYPATGYGYIERAAPGAASLGTAFAVESFREKPARELARQFLQAGTYFWNAGIFLWRASGILQLIDDFQPEISQRLLRLGDSLGTPGWDAALRAEFPGMPSISIDYGVLEPMAALRDAKRPVFVVPASFEWDDVGSWEALPRVLGVDPEGNAISGPQCGIDTRGCVIRTTSDHLVATFGISNLIVVHTPEATLIAPRDDENAMRRLVAQLEERGYGRFL